MLIAKIADGKYINVDRMTYVEPQRKGQLTVHFAVGGGDVAGPSCRMKLEQEEAERFIRWLDSHNQSSKS
ncbi:MAG: hypothetical protein KAY65_11860 [Planctomycetes bacterium]|nr:hypothetical protein [Planctomycetota bacterium]